MKLDPSSSRNIMAMDVSPTESTPVWHTLRVETVCAFLKTAATGLTNAEAARRLTEHGPNELQAAHRISPWMILFEQFKNVLIVILLVATVLSVFLGHGIEAIAIAVIVLFAVLLGFVQEYRAERAIEACPRRTVLRNPRRARTIRPSRRSPCGCWRSFTRPSRSWSFRGCWRITCMGRTRFSTRRQPSLGACRSSVTCGRIRRCAFRGRRCMSPRCSRGIQECGRPFGFVAATR